MSPLAAPARMFSNPVASGCARLFTGDFTIVAMATTTTTITTGSGWESVRE